MSDVTDHNQSGKRRFEEYWWRGVLLVQIWRDVSSVILASGVQEGEELKRLDELKREMWLLLVAAGSGYLARCWHKTLAPKRQLTEFAHQETPESEVVESSTSSPQQPRLLLNDAPPNVLQQKSPVSVSKESSSKPRRTFSPKALGKKLFSDGGRSVKAAKKAEANALGLPEESNALIRPAGEIFQEASVAQSTKRSPWSAFKSKSKEGFSGDIFRSKSKEFSPAEGSRSKTKIWRTRSKERSTVEISKEWSGPLKQTGDASGKSLDQLQSESRGSHSSRSLGGLAGEWTDGSLSPSIGSSRREEVQEKSPLGFFVDKGDDSSNAFSSKNLAEDGCVPVQLNVVECDPKPISSGTSEISNSEDRVGPTYISVDDKGSLISRGANVADEARRIEMGNLSTKSDIVNAVLSLRAANQSQVSKSGTDSGEVPFVRNLAQSSLNAQFDTGDTGVKVKRRADSGKEVVDGGQILQSISGKRSKDSNQLLFSDSTDVVTPTNVTAKRMKDVSHSHDESNDDSGNSNESSNLWALGPMDLSQVFYGFESSFSEPTKDVKSPFKVFRRLGSMSKSAYKNIRKIRESPKPVSALESCLRAQLHERDERPNAVRALNFSSLTIPRNLCGDSSSDLEVGTTFLNIDSLSQGLLVSGSELSGDERLEGTRGALGLPLLTNSPSRREDRQLWKGGPQVVVSSPKYPRKVVLEDGFGSQPMLNDIVWRTTSLPVPLKKRRVSQACSASAASSDRNETGYEVEAMVIPPMEGLLFSFGVGIGVMSLINGPDKEVEKLSKQLQESEQKIEILNNLLRQAEDSALHAEQLSSKEVNGDDSCDLEVTGKMNGKAEPLSVPDLPASNPAVNETEREMEVFERIRREAPETPQQTEHMAELEAELEAELDALTSGVSGSTSAPPDYEELDPEGVAGIADHDLGIEGLPAVLDWDDDNDDFITEPPTFSGGGVPPKELTRLLRKVQSSLQEHRIADLEADLLETVAKLESMETELRLLREEAASLSYTSAGPRQEFLEPRTKDDTRGTLHADATVGKLNVGDTDDKVNVDDTEDTEDNAKVDDVKDEVNVVQTENLNVDDTEDKPHVDDTESEIYAYDADSKPYVNDTIPGEQISSQVESHKVLNDSHAVEESGEREDTSFQTFKSAYEPIHVSKGLVLSSKASEAVVEVNAQADNDAVCDEFLDSVFGSSEIDMSREERHLLSMPFISLNSTPQSPEPGITLAEEMRILNATNDLKLRNPVNPPVEDLDQVVGELLLKRDSNSVKNALNAFLLWEAEAESNASKDDAAEDEINQIYSRRAAGKNSTPQKLSLFSLTSQNLSVIPARNEIPTSPFNSDKKTQVEKLGGISRVSSFNMGEKGLNLAESLHEDAVAHVAKFDAKHMKLLGMLEHHPLLKKDQGSPTSKKDAGKGDTGRIDKLRSEPPVFGGEKDFQALLDKRRELRYTSTRVQLSLTAQPQERDLLPVFRQREDSSRAGTNSPTGKVQGVVYSGSKSKNSRIIYENRLYQNLTSDWLSEIGSPPDSQL